MDIPFILLDYFSCSKLTNKYTMAICIAQIEKKRKNSTSFISFKFFLGIGNTQHFLGLNFFEINCRCQIIVAKLYLSVGV